MPGERFRRWFSLRRLLATGILGALVGCAFVAGFYLGSEIGMDKLKQQVKGIIDPSSRKPLPPGAWKVVTTLLHDVVIDRIALPQSRRTGGAIEQVNGLLLFATPEGHLGYLDAEGAPQLLDVRVPMNNEGMRQDPIASHPRFDIQYLRVTDMLALEVGPSRYRVLVSHHRYEDGCIDLRVSELALEASNGTLRSLDTEMSTLFVAHPCMGFRSDAEFVFAGHHAGGRMLPYGDGQLLLTVGDHRFDGTHGMPEPMPPSLPEERAFPMDPGVSLGKVLLLDLNSGDAEVFALGLRNPQGLIEDDQGRIWVTDHGPQGGDELNLIERGRNYGWPEVTLGVAYGSRPWPFNPMQGRHAGYTMPRYAWVPSIGTSNLVQAGATQFPLWEGDLLVTSLIGMSVFRLRMHDGRVIYEERIEIGERIRDAIVLDDGRIALYADSPNVVLILRNGGSIGDGRQVGAPPLGVMEDPDSEGARIFLASCAACHSLRGQPGVGPPLDGVMGRAVGSTPGFAFSQTMRNADEPWTRNRMAAYIRSPQSMYRGSRMNAVDLSDAQLETLLTFLEGQVSGPET